MPLYSVGGGGRGGGGLQVGIGPGLHSPLIHSTYDGGGQIPPFMDFGGGHFIPCGAQEASSS